MNEELWESTSNQCGLCLPTQHAAAKAAFRPAIRCSGRGNGSLYFGRWEPEVERYGAVFNSMTPRGASTRLASFKYASGSATCSMTECDNTKSNDPSANGSAVPSAYVKLTFVTPFSAARRIAT